MNLYTFQGVSVIAEDADDARAQLCEAYGAHDFTDVREVPGHTATKVRNIDTGAAWSETVAEAAAAKGRGFPYGLGPLWIDGRSVEPRA